MAARANVVIVTGRDVTKLAQAKVKIPKLVTITSDAANLDDVKALEREVTRSHPALNVLVNNARVMQELNVHRDTLDAEEAACFEARVLEAHASEGTVRDQVSGKS